MDGAVLGGRHRSNDGNTATKRAGGARVGFSGTDGVELTPPGKVPGVPEVAHVGSDYVEILWAPPQYIGSAPITGYEICARVGGVGEFDTLTVTDDVECAASVPVAPEVWLEFTVCAQSDAGPGAPSRPSMPVLTRRVGRQSRGGGRRQGASKSRGGGRRRHASAASGEALSDEDLSDVGDTNDADDTRLAVYRDGAHRRKRGPKASGSSAAHATSSAGSAADAEADVALAELMGAANAARYTLLRAELAELETTHASKLGRAPSDEELASNPAYRELALEYAGLRELRSRAMTSADTRGRANRDWQQTLTQLGFDVSTRLVQLELDRSRWHMDFSKRNKGKQATVQDQLMNRGFVQLQEAIRREAANVSHAQRALDRVSSFPVYDAVVKELETAQDDVDDRLSMSSLAGQGSLSLSAMRVRALLDLLVAYDSSGTGVLSAIDFERLLVGELGAAALPHNGSAIPGLPKPDTTVDATRAERMHERADMDQDGVVDLNELVRHFAPAFRKHEKRRTEQRRVSLSQMSSVAADEEPEDGSYRGGGLSKAADLVGRAAVHLAGSTSYKKSFRRKRAAQRAQRAQQRALDDGALSGGEASGGEVGGGEAGGEAGGGEAGARLSAGSGHACDHGLARHGSDCARPGDEGRAAARDTRVASARRAGTRVAASRVW